MRVGHQKGLQRGGRGGPRVRIRVWLRVRIRVGVRVRVLTTLELYSIATENSTWKAYIPTHRRIESVVRKERQRVRSPFFFEINKYIYIHTYKCKVACTV